MYAAPVADARAGRTRDKEGGHLERRERGVGHPAGRSDEEILALVRAGETRRFAQIVERYQDVVYGMAARLTGSVPDAEDIAQEAFLRVHRGLVGFKGDARFSTWLYRITFNLCTDWLRRNHRPGRRPVALEEAGVVEDPRAGVESGLLDAEARAGVRAAVDGLDEKYRVVVVLLYYQKLSYDQIAAILEVPVKTVETRLYRARGILRARLEGTREGGGS